MSARLPCAIRIDNATATSTTALPLTVSVVDFDKPWRQLACDVQVHAECTYEQLADVVHVHLLCNEEQKAAWPHVAGFYSFDGVHATMSRQIHCQNFQAFDRNVRANITSVITLVISTRPDSNFSGCRSLQSYAPAIERQLSVFCYAPQASEGTVPSPTVGPRKCKTVVRKAYTRLAGEVQRYVDKDHKAIVITGTPGVGKTLFLWYLLGLHRSKAPVVFDCAGVFLLVHPNGSTIRRERGASFRQYLADEKTMYLCDAAPGRKPLMGFDIVATTIVTKSPDQPMIKQFVKAAQPKVLFMPLWTIEELEECRAACFHSTTKETIAILFAHFGGTARETLVPDEDLPTKLAEFDSVLNSLTDRTIQLNLNLIEKPGVVDTKQGDVCHKILHLEPVKDQDQLDEARVVPASFIVSCEPVKRDGAAKKQRIRRILSSTAGEPTFAATRGIRKLDDDNASGHAVLTLPVKPTEVVFDDILKVNDAEYAVPRARNFPVIDALMKPTRLVQMTVSDTHPINHGKLKEILGKLAVPKVEDTVQQEEQRGAKKQRLDTTAASAKSGTKRQPGKKRNTKRQRSPSPAPEPTPEDTPKEKGYQSFFAVPDDRFDSFKMQPFVNMDDDNILPIEQYALCIDLSDKPVKPRAQRRQK